MNRKIMYSVLSGALLIGTTVVRAQHATPEEAPPPPEFMLQDREPGPGGPDGPGEPFGGMELLGFGGMHGGKVVKGVPFSATAVSESTQTLADGNHITRNTKANLFRDSQGRFRREATVPALGAAAGAGQTHSFVFINDPVAGTGYMLQPDKKEAFQMNKGKSKNNEGDAAARKEKFKEKFDARQQKEIADGTLKIDNLGTQTVAGVAAQGTRRTRTIPAGKMGNDKPITIVSEEWYSNDLQIVVSSKHSDPRFGDRSFTLTSVQRTEPAATLFTVPSDYTVKQGHGGPRGRRRGLHGPGMGGPGAPPPPPNAPAPSDN